MMRTLLAFFLFVILIGVFELYGDAALAQQKAFPEAEGYGAFVTGGRGGAVYHVTSLADSGAGTLRDAVSQPNRIVVFDTSGVINLSSVLVVKSNITIAGQTAPGGGITIYNNYVSLSNVSNVIMRDIRIHAGVNSSSGAKALSATDCTNLIFDHVSVEWGRWDNTGLTKDAVGAGMATFQNCIIGEPLNPQYFGGLFENAEGVTFSHNLFIDNWSRNPKVKGTIQYINNVVYNFGIVGLCGGHSGAVHNLEVIGNTFISGPSTTAANQVTGEYFDTDWVYQTGNVKDVNKNGVLDSVPVVPSDYYQSTTYPGPTFYDAPLCNNIIPIPVPVTIDSAATAYTKVLAGAGAMPQNRDPVDTRLVAQLTSLGTLGNARVNDESVVGGQPAMTVVTRPAGFDSDNDGIPDTWETAHGLNPSLASDANLTNPIGYYMVEQYINELASIHATRTWNSNGSDWGTPGIWASATPTNNDNAYVVGEGSGTNGLVTVTTNAACFSLHIGGNGSTTPDKVTVSSGGALAVNDTIYVGDQSNGTLEIQNGGTVQAWNVQLGNTVGGTTYTGNLLLSGGTLKTVQVVLGGGTPGNWTTGGTCTWSGGTVQAMNTFKFAVPATIGAGGATLDSNGFACTVSGALSGNGGLTKIGSGNLTLSASNTFYGDTKIYGGAILLSNANALQNSTLDYSNYGGTLSFGTLTGAVLGGLKGNQSLALTNASSAAVQLQVGGNGQSTSYSGAVSGAGTLTKAGSGALTLTATNTFNGPVNFNGGLMQASALNRLGNGTLLNFNGGGLQFGGVFDPSTRTMTFQSGGATLDTNGKDIILANSIGNGGSGGLTKTGSGTLTLNAPSTYTGDTIVSGGKLELAPMGQIATTSDITTSDPMATFQVDSGPRTVGNISGVGTTILAAGANLTATSVAQNTITLGAGATLTIAALPGGPTAGGGLAQPVPEPSGIVLLIIAALGILCYWKRSQ